MPSTSSEFTLNSHNSFSLSCCSLSSFALMTFSTLFLHVGFRAAISDLCLQFVPEFQFSELTRLAQKRWQAIVKRGTMNSMRAMTQTIFISSTSDNSSNGPSKPALFWPVSLRHSLITLEAETNPSLFCAIYELTLFASRSSITTSGIGMSTQNRIGKKLKFL